MPEIAVLGTGMAGFGAAHRLHAEGVTPVLYDKNGYHGGHTASFRNDHGFIFDLGPGTERSRMSCDSINGQ